NDAFRNCPPKCSENGGLRSTETFYTTNPEYVLITRNPGPALTKELFDTQVDLIYPTVAFKQNRTREWRESNARDSANNQNNVALQIRYRSKAPPSITAVPLPLSSTCQIDVD
ncbi:hypothetical protein N7505_007493, partial [Penicillium chrysogenum]